MNEGRRRQGGRHRGSSGKIEPPRPWPRPPSEYVPRKEAGTGEEEGKPPPGGLRR